MEHGHSLVIPPHFDGNNYAYWKVRMKASLQEKCLLARVKGPRKNLNIVAKGY